MRNNRKRHNSYQGKIVAAIDSSKVQLTPGSVSTIHVYHDDWCAIFKGGTCNCNPDLVQEIKPKGE